MDLLARLTQIQRSLNASDAEFAARIGITDPAWNLIRNGKREMGRKALAGIYRAFPELSNEILDYATTFPTGQHAAA